MYTEKFVNIENVRKYSPWLFPIGEKTEFLEDGSFGKHLEERCKNCEIIEKNKILFEENKRLSEKNIYLELIQGIIHDSNNICNIIGGSLELNTLTFKELELSESEKLDRIKEKNHAMLGALSKLIVLNKRALSFSEVNRKQNYEKIAINEFFCTLKQLQLGKNNISWRSNLNKVDFYVFGDLIDLERVFLNIYVNARDAMLPSGGGILEVLARKEEDYVAVSVVDNGKGIPEECLQYIFESGFTSGKKFGNGYGLASALEIINNHNGHINVKSELGKGTKFEIYLPSFD
ncbi:MAG: HAMP domain-containing sensor histidine kinase [archaeon]